MQYCKCIAAAAAAAVSPTAIIQFIVNGKFLVEGYFHLHLGPDFGSVVFFLFTGTVMGGLSLQLPFYIYKVDFNL